LSQEISCRFDCCNKRFIRKADLEIHFRIDSGDKPFISNYNEYNQKFAQKSNLNKDMKRHLNIRKFKFHYNECDKSKHTIDKTFK
jgi:uncharacterized Zn-finger protein